MFPLKKGDIYRRLALQLMDPYSVAPSNIRIIIIAYAKNGKCQQPERSSETSCVHVLCLAASSCLLAFTRKRLLERTDHFSEKKVKTEQERKMGGLPCIEGCNLICSIY